VNLAGHKLLEETDDHFHIEGPDGAFKVAKAHLHHATVQRIKRHFASGGEVGAESDQEGPDVETNRETDRRLAANMDSEKPGSGAEWLAGRHPEGQMGTPTQQGESILDDMDRRHPLTDSPMDQLDASRSAAPHMPPGLSGDWFKGTADNTMDPGLPGSSDTQSAAPADPQAAAAPSPDPAASSAQPAPTPQPKPEGPLGPPSGLQQGINTEMRGIRESGAAQSEGYARQAQVASSAADQYKALDNEMKQTLVSRSAGQQKLFNDYMTGKVDPNRYWHNLGTGGRISASIGMILSGIGAGMSGGPNLAVQMLDRNIDRDIESQKLDLGKKGTALDMYMKQTGDLTSAMHLVKAEALTTTAASLQSEALKTGSQQAVAIANQHVGALQQKGAQELQQGTMGQYQIKGAQLNEQLQQQHMQALGQLLRGVSGGGGFDRRILEMPGFENYRERAVDLPDGSVSFAADKKEAEAAGDSMATVSRLKAKLGRYTRMLNSGSPETMDRGSAQEMHADLLSEMGHLHDLNRLTDVDLDLFKQQVPDISRWLSLKGQDRQRLEGVGKSIDDRVWGVNKRLLHRPDSQRPGQ